jgi:thiol-disulfide isomerase/thioredoxin
MAHAFTRWLLFALMVACNGAKEGPFEGQQAPRFQGPTMTGGNLHLDGGLGKPTVLVFWASWCGPCRKEAPAVARIAASYGDTVNIIGINTGESLSAARRAAPQMGITWPVVMDTDGVIQARYKVSGIPLVVILDQKGLVRHRNNGVPSDIHRLLDGLSR